MDKRTKALRAIRSHPENWFRGEPIEERDLLLINTDPPLPLVKYGPESFLRKLASDPSCTVTYLPSILLTGILPTTVSPRNRQDRVWHDRLGRRGGHRLQEDGF